MVIKPSYFENGGEVTLKTCYKEGSRTGSASLRRVGLDLFEIYVKWDYPKDCEMVIFRGSLEECIRFSNAKFLSNDKVEE